MLIGRVGTSRQLDQQGDTRYTERMTVLLNRLQEQPEVAAVTYAERFPGGSEWRPAMEAEGEVRIRSRVNLVASNLFDVFGVRVIAGRGFTAGDMRPETPAAIVDQEFADRLAPGGNVVGRRIRFPAPDGENPNPWMEIVGVVPVFSNQFTAPGYFGKPTPSLYVAGGPGRTHPATLIVRLKSGDPARYEQKLQEITASVDPTLRVEQVMGVVDQWHHDTRAYWMMAIAIVAVTASVLLLSAAGIYAMMSFTVARRWREIGIRVALGADARRVLMGIFGRAGVQIGAGVALGLLVAGLAEFMTEGGNIGGKGLVLFPAVVAVMFVVGMLAAAGPARRGLSVQPTEALRNE
jgi:hypothetical protein